MTTETEQRAERARALLEDPLLKESLAEIEKQDYEALLSLAPDQHQERLTLACQIRATRALPDRLRAAMTMAQIEAKPRFQGA